MHSVRVVACLSPTSPIIKDLLKIQYKECSHSRTKGFSEILDVQSTWWIYSMLPGRVCWGASAFPHMTPDGLLQTFTALHTTVHLLHPSTFYPHSTKPRTRHAYLPSSQPWHYFRLLVGTQPYPIPNYYLTIPQCLFLPVIAKIVEAEELAIKSYSFRSQITNSNIAKKKWLLKIVENDGDSAAAGCVLPLTPLN